MIIDWEEKLAELEALNRETARNREKARFYDRLAVGLVVVSILIQIASATFRVYWEMNQ